MQALHLPPTSDPPLQQRNLQQKKYLPILCDVRIRSSILAAFQTIISNLGSIDVIANCSSQGIVGACEDQSEADIRDQFETNFMGTLNILQISLPYFRQCQAGRYVIYNGTSGALGMPGQGPYCATKCAVEGLVESMLYEVENFGIRATLVFGGPMRTDETEDVTQAHPNESAQNSDGNLTDEKSQPGPPSHNFKIKPVSGPYSSSTSPASHFKRTVQWIGNNQPTSAIKSAEILWQLGHCSFPPLRLMLGNYAVETTRDRLRSILEEVEDWKHLDFPSTGTDYEVLDEAKEDQDQHDGLAQRGGAGAATMGEEKEDGDDNKDDGEEGEASDGKEPTEGSATVDHPH
jgi:NAD(P)-dependent dehydrogenase (short-subunit alcohol dehydrogenase family)